MGLYFAKLDISTNNTKKIMEIVEQCPYFVNAYTLSGKHNLCIFLMAEYIGSLEAISKDHIRSNPLVLDAEFNIITRSTKDIIIPTNLIKGHREKAPCNTDEDCKDCPYFKEKKCMGCPITGQHQGWLF